MRMHDRSRGAYTLLEVMLALVLGLLLMVALYAAMDVQLRHIETGREIVEHGMLVRGLLNRMASDIVPSLTPISNSNASAANAASGTAAAGSPATSSASSALPPNVFVMQGDSSHLTVFSSLVPQVNLNTSVPVSDLRKITYWLAGDSSNPLGLARQERTRVTSDDASDPVLDEATYVIAEEVKSLQFQYFDGQSWQDSWDGTPPNGPPMAIAIILAVPDVKNPSQMKTFRHVVAITTANGLAQTSSVGAAP